MHEILSLPAIPNGPRRAAMFFLFVSVPFFFLLCAAKPPIQPDGAVDEQDVHYVYVCRKE
jgi:hypothetical protein